MGAESEKLLHHDITKKIIRGYYDVFDVLPYGLPESAYHRAMLIALKDLGLQYETEVDLPVYFRGQVVGRYRADLIVEGSVIVENKTAPRIVDAHRTQTLSYQQIAKLQVGMLLNFGPEAEFERTFLRAQSRTRPPSPRRSAQSEGG